MSQRKAWKSPRLTREKDKHLSEAPGGLQKEAGSPTAVCHHALHSNSHLVGQIANADRTPVFLTRPPITQWRRRVETKCGRSPPATKKTGRQQCRSAWPTYTSRTLLSSRGRPCRRKRQSPKTQSCKHTPKGDGYGVEDRPY